jgi:hypothetical protein
MSGTQVSFLLLMAMLGLFGAFGLADASPRVRGWAAAWVALWLTPPLVRLWIAGVMGV